MDKTIKYKISKKGIVNISFLLTIAFFITTSCTTNETQTVATFTNLVMQDEFEGDGLDTTIWDYQLGDGTNYELPSGWGNNELQIYTSDDANIQVNAGVLIIKAIEDSNDLGYTSARIVTSIEQTYGRFEARMWLPYGQGIWPAFWMLGADSTIFDPDDDDDDAVEWPGCGEIDIMEYVGQEPTTIHGTVHGTDYSGTDGITKSYTLENDRFDTGFHIFGIEWDTDYINFYVDDVLYNQITPADVTGEWLFDHPFKVIINLAVGGDFVGSPNEETVFPQYLLVDYVRLYSN